MAVVLLVGALLPAVEAYSRGIGILSVCDTMAPGHGGSAKSNVNAPYEVITQQSTVSAGASISVTIRSKSSADKFRGFMLQARSPSGTIIGSWDAAIPSESLRQNCNNANDIVTHSFNSDKTEKTFQWIAPGSLTEDVTFVCSFVKTSSPGDYWVKLSSSKVTFSQQQITVGSSPSTETTITQQQGNTETLSTSTDAQNLGKTQGNGLYVGTVAFASTTPTAAASPTSVASWASTETSTTEQQGNSDKATRSTNVQTIIGRTENSSVYMGNRAFVSVATTMIEQAATTTILDSGQTATQSAEEPDTSTSLHSSPSTERVSKQPQGNTEKMTTLTVTQSLVHTTEGSSANVGSSPSITTLFTLVGLTCVLCKDFDN